MMRIRSGTIEDFDVVIALMDEAVAWLAGQGRTGQWGSEPISALTRSVEYMRREVEGNDLWIAEIGGEPVGAMLLGEAPTRYVEPVGERELFLHLLVTSRRVIGQGVGRALVKRAIDVARERGIDLIRVDCYGGDDRKLVTAYERLGFTPTHVVMVNEWPAQVLEMRVSGSMSKTDTG
jgi:GNAT superfamily N-acetyltransferase